MLFGIATVNKYCDYHQTWGALFSELSGSGWWCADPRTAQAQDRAPRRGNNDLEIVEHGEPCLVYDRPMSQTGLTWRQLTA